MSLRLLGRLLLIATPLLLIFLAVTNQGLAQNTNQAGIVIRLGDSDLVSRCIAFFEEDISGLELLERSGLATQIRAEGMGSLVCSINDTGCPADDCFCECRGGAECIYWSYWQQSDEGWQYARLGASSYRVSNGEIQGWSWGPGSLTEAVAPPELTIEQVCSEQPVENTDVAQQQQELEIDVASILPFVLLLALLAGGALLIYRRRSV
jgi:hypothetical protein